MRPQNPLTPAPLPQGGEGDVDLNLLPSPPWGRGWTATGAFSSRGGPGLRPPKGKRRAVNNIGFGPQAGEGVAPKQIGKEFPEHSLREQYSVVLGVRRGIVR